MQWKRMRERGEVEYIFHMIREKMKQRKKRFYYRGDSYKPALVWSSLCWKDWCNEFWPWLGAETGDVCMSISLLNGPRFVALIYMEAQYQTHHGDKSAAILGVISGLYSSSVSIALIHVTSVIWNQTALYYSVVAELIPAVH